MFFWFSPDETVARASWDTCYNVSLLDRCADDAEFLLPSGWLFPLQTPWQVTQSLLPLPPYGFCHSLCILAISDSQLRTLASCWRGQKVCFLFRQLLMPDVTRVGCDWLADKRESPFLDRHVMRYKQTPFGTKSAGPPSPDWTCPSNFCWHTERTLLWAHSAKCRRLPLWLK